MWVLFLGAVLVVLGVVEVGVGVCVDLRICGALGVLDELKCGGGGGGGGSCGGGVCVVVRLALENRPGMSRVACGVCVCGGGGALECA